MSSALCEIDQLENSSKTKPFSASRGLNSHNFALKSHDHALVACSIWRIKGNLRGSFGLAGAPQGPQELPVN
jgi:hypothetical protein